MRTIDCASIVLGFELFRRECFWRQMCASYNYHYQLQGQKVMQKQIHVPKLNTPKLKNRPYGNFSLKLLDVDFSSIKLFVKLLISLYMLNFICKLLFIFVSGFQCTSSPTPQQVLDYLLIGRVKRRTIMPMVFTGGHVCDPPPVALLQMKLSLKNHSILAHTPLFRCAVNFVLDVLFKSEFESHNDNRPFFFTPAMGQIIFICLSLNIFYSKETDWAG